MRYTQGGTAIAKLGLAVNRKYTAQNGELKEEVTFVDCTAFAKQAETLSKYVTKGRPLFIEGRLNYSTWEDKDGGGKRSKLEVVIENFQFVDSGAGRGGARGAEEGGESAPPRRGAQPQGGGAAGASGEQVDYGDVPF
jgi:single-strand DNA-binding protein